MPAMDKAVKGIKQLKLTHISGGVTCNKNKLEKTNFGCKGMGIAIMITKNDQMVAPVFSDPEITKKKDHKKNGNFMFWDVKDKDWSSNMISYNVDNLSFEQTDSIQAYYSEAYNDYTLQDNDGVTCIKVEA